MEKALSATYDLLLLDLVLPHHGGFEILQQLEIQRPGVAAIVLSAKGQEEDRCRGLRLGADDYMVKPFSVRELIARVEAVLRRSPERPRERDSFPLPGGATAHLERREVVFSDGTSEQLSERETELLRYMARYPGRTISREEILRRVWRLDPAHLETRTIDMHIAHLREKLRDPPSAPKIIRTIRGCGYALKTEDE